MKEDEEMQTVKDKEREAMRAAEDRPDEEMQTVKNDQEEDTRVVTEEDGMQTLKDKQEKMQSQMDKDETRHSPDVQEVQMSTGQEVQMNTGQEVQMSTGQEVQMSTGQEEWEGQTEQGQEEEKAQTSQGESEEVGQTEMKLVTVTRKEVSNKDDLHTDRGEQEDGVQACSRPEEEGQPDGEDVEKSEDDKEETDVSSLGQDMRPQDSASSSCTPPQAFLNFDLMPPPPQRSLDTECSSPTENSQTDVGPLVQGDDHHSPLKERHSDALTATKQTIQDQERPRETEVMTEDTDAMEGHSKSTDQETREHMGEIESRKNLQEEASVNTPTTTAQERSAHHFPADHS
ncbi:RE1-silencing transcription factor-like [Clupea harengus]|uniref:RE1-silencing transcription factor-like n=1 Tax=Clupea harengus TaxID=7950 RepID=A0A8M1K897_CLUHA|nr:RE1-silencing transcription factor-like [Clupea harengus]